MRYSSTLIGMGMRYSLISMVVFKNGPACVCLCVSRGGRSGRGQSLLSPGFATRAACSNVGDGSHLHSYLGEEESQGIQRQRSRGGCRFSASCVTYKPQEEFACLSQDQTLHTSQHILCVSSSPPTDLLQGNPLT